MKIWVSTSLFILVLTECFLEIFRQEGEISLHLAFETLFYSLSESVYKKSVFTTRI